MSLSKAHEGYEYQDLLSCYFILNEILNENQSEFYIDRKVGPDDRLDDLTIINETGEFKKQIKYSSIESKHVFKKEDISTDSKYNIALDKLYHSWKKKSPNKTSEFRLCLAWDGPDVDLKDILISKTGYNSFHSFNTNVYKLNIDKLWPKGQMPLSSWKRFKKESKKINREEFKLFCDALLIEIGLPKFSLDIQKPGDLERLVIQQVQKLGIGVYPNNSKSIQEFSLSLLAIVKRSRSQGETITTDQIFKELNIITNFGSIKQTFPVNKVENVYLNRTLKYFDNKIKGINHILLLGEPGSGKSWFVTNFQKYLRENKINVIKHYCYTDLNDIHQIERIKTNVFYGNLIRDILVAFPKLKNAKSKMFASNLEELNSLLQNITEPTFLIVDGLDHIERIKSFRRFSQLSKDDVNIIENLSRLTPSKNVKLLIASQDVPELQSLNNYTRIALPSWKENEIKELLQKRLIENNRIDNKKTLSNLLFNKSEGNPLYLKYLLDEISKLNKITSQEIDSLPAYSYNIEAYYKYLLEKLDTKLEVPQILSGVNFSLTKNEIKEITHLGNFVDESLSVLSPIVKINLAFNGYVIYHESFRRFIIETLRTNNVSIEKKVVEPVVEWFKSKDFYSYKKSFKFYLPFLYQNDRFSEILQCLNKKFVTTSLYNGQNWSQIERNFHYFVLAACYEKDFSKIILINEISKIIGLAKGTFDEVRPQYFRALGKAKGWDKVSEYLVFEGKPELHFQEGIRVCYSLDDIVVAPWKIFVKPFIKSKKVNKEDFKYFIKGLLAIEKEDLLLILAKKLEAKKYLKFAFDYIDELRNPKYSVYVSHLSNKFPEINKILSRKDFNINIPFDQVLSMSDAILKFEHIFHSERELLDNFLSFINRTKLSPHQINSLIDKFKGRNWFFNWLIYYLKISQIKFLKKTKPIILLDAFSYLNYNTSPFQGKPNVTDLYYIHELIYDSLKTGLKFIKNADLWKIIINLLIEVSNETAVSMRGSYMHPLTTERLLTLLISSIPEESKELLLPFIKKITNDKSEYHLHQDIGIYYFKLCELSHSLSETKNSKEYFEKGLEYILGYTFHKDLTLYDALTGIEYMHKNNYANSLKDLITIKEFVNSAIQHTDGKETYYFPIKWFESFIKIDLKKSAIYLLKELSTERCYWMDEENLLNLLIELKDKVDPIIQFYIAFTFPIVHSDKFMFYLLGLLNKLENSNVELSGKLMIRIIELIKPNSNNSLAEKTIKLYNEEIEKRKFDVKFLYPVKDKAVSKTEEILIVKKIPKSRERNILISYLFENKILPENFPELEELLIDESNSAEFKKIILFTIVKRAIQNYETIPDLYPILKQDDDLRCYFGVLKFVFEYGGYHQRFVNYAEFGKSYHISSEKSINYLFSLFPEVLDTNLSLELSANLIRALTEVNFDQEIVNAMWKQVLEVTEYRLPAIEKISESAIFPDDNGMNFDEIALCILLTRYNANTTERYQVVTAGIDHILTVDKNKLTKPLSWLIENNEKFNNSVKQTILQMINRLKDSGSNYYRNFLESSNKISPTHNFSIDFLLNKIFEKPLSEIIVNSNLKFPQVNDDLQEFFKSINWRYSLMENLFLNLEEIFNEYSATFNSKFHDYFELYYNKMYKKSIPHTYCPEYLLKLINENLYSELKDMQKDVPEPLFQNALLLDIEGIVTHFNSFSQRPLDLNIPINFEKGYSIKKNEELNGWVRLGHYEKSLSEEATWELKEAISYGGIVFSNEPNNIFPYSNYNIHPYHLWKKLDYKFELTSQIIIARLQEDLIEFYNYIWINPQIIETLGLKTIRSINGLIAINDKGVEIIKMRSWRTNYVASGISTSLHDELPKSIGTDLIIQKDYFKKLSALFVAKPNYVVYRK